MTGDSSFRERVDDLEREIAELYLSDAIPWVIGYSGGKDSTAVLQLAWRAIASIPAAERAKPVHVISTDTLVENPIVAIWVARSLDRMNEKAEAAGLPIRSHRLVPDPGDTFWVNLIGRGYAAPRPKFRWCTKRLKIDPSTRFITSMVQEHGETILLLGTRKAESAARARTMARHAEKRVRDRLSPNAGLPNSLVYSPIEDWTSDDVWMFLMQDRNPWGHDNKDLLTMYRGASADGECPLVVDSTTPSCGDSRFGCWVCTLVEKDKSMQAMISNDDEKEWMLPLLELRDQLDPRGDPDGDRGLRDFRRMSGAVQLFNDRVIPGPYTQDARAGWLRRVLAAQRRVREAGPPDVRGIELVTLPELEEIRRIWVFEKHEIEDLLPGIYEDAAGEPWPGGSLGGHLPMGAPEMDLLRGLCGGDDLHFQLVREMLSVEMGHRSMLRRAGVHDALEAAIKRGFYDSEDDAISRARARAGARA